MIPSSSGSTYDADVLIVGAGPVGMTLALLLERWGVSSLLLDRRAANEPCEGSRALCQQRDVLDSWCEIGVGEQLVRDGVTWRTARTFFGEQELFALELPRQPSDRLPPFVNVSQATTEKRLQQQVLQRASIRQSLGVEVRSLNSGTVGVEVEAVSTNEPEAHTRLRGRYGVLSSGSSCGPLREQLGINFPGHSFDDRFLICDIRVDLPDWAEERRFWFDPPWNPGRQVLIHPQPDSVYRIDWQVPPDFDLDAEELSGALDERIRAIVGEQPYEIVWRSVYRFHSRCADRFRRGNWFLAGDSAHVVAPFGARGLNSGVHDAENLAWKLGLVLHGMSHPELLDSYESERRAAALENLEVTTATMDFLVPQTKAQSKHRLTTLHAAADGDSAALQAIDSGRLYEPFWYVDSPLTTDDPDRPFPGRPPRGQLPAVAPGVLLPDLIDRSGTPLRSLARRGLLLILGSQVGAKLGLGVTAGIDLPFEVYHRTLGPELEPSSAAALDLRDDEFCVVRPDAHIAGFSRRPSDVLAIAEGALRLRHSAVTQPAGSPSGAVT